MHRNFALSLLTASLFLSSGITALAQESTDTTAPAADATAKTEEKTSDKVDKSTDKAKTKKDKKADKQPEVKSEAKTETKTEAKTDAKADAKPEAKKDSTKKASSSSGDGIGAIPAHIASFAVGTMVGIPVSIFRKSKTETISATKDLVGDTDNKFLLGAAGILGVPAGVLSGSMQGFFYGPMNAWKGTADEPFSEEAFSLGDSK